jgi:hypothetical protein
MIRFVSLANFDEPRAVQQVNGRIAYGDLLEELAAREQFNEIQAAVRSLSYQQRVAWLVARGLQNCDLATTDLPPTVSLLAKQWGCPRHRVYYLANLADQAIRRAIA